MSPHGAILMYHRVASADHDPWSLCVSPDHFAEQLEVLSRRADVMPLQRLFDAIPTSSRNRPPVAITFDDGYADNLHAAKPVLDRHDMSATLFVASGYTGSDRPFWSDELVRIVLGAQTLPTHLVLTIDGVAFERDIARDAAYEADSREPRRSLLFDLWNRLRPLRRDEQTRLLDELRRWAGGPDAATPAARPLSHDELRRLAADGRIEIGAHTVSHCELPARPVAEQMREVAGSKADCEAITGRPVTSFAYPYGRFDETSVACVRAAGFTLACSTRPGLSLRRTDRLRLPRLAVQDWNGDEFERRFRLRFDPVSCVA